MTILLFRGIGGGIIGLICLFLFMVTFMGRMHQKTVEAFARPTTHWGHSHRVTLLQTIVSTAASEDTADWVPQKPRESDKDVVTTTTTTTSLTSPPPPENKKETTPQPTTGYERIEDWEADQEESRKNGTMTWKERAQFDSERNENQDDKMVY